MALTISTSGAAPGAAASDPLRRLASDYAAAFCSYLSEPEEFALVRAYELGRAALMKGLGVLEMATVHSVALAHALERPLPPAELDRLLDGSEKFLVEALSPFEMGHRGFREANGTLRRLNEVLEGQSKRIAYALHDEAAQLLVPIHLGLADVARKVPEEIAVQLRAIRSLLDAIEERLRNLSHELRPPILDDFGLIPALEFLANSMSKRWGLPVRVHASLDRSVPATVETTVYRITQEALTNVVRHARATAAQVSLTHTARALICSVCDDGVGFDAGAGERRQGLGLAEIRERVTALGGLLRVEPNDGRGTKLTVEIPLEY